MADAVERIDGLEYEVKKLLNFMKKTKEEISDLRHKIGNIEGKVNMDLSDMKQKLDDVVDSHRRLKRKVDGDGGDPAQ